MSGSRVPLVWDPRTDEHRDIQGVWVGVPEPGDEEPDRAHAILDSFAAVGVSPIAATEHGDVPLRAVHDAEFVDFLDCAHAEWIARDYPERSGQPLVMPYLFPSTGFTLGTPPRRAHAIHAQAGRFATDTMTPIGPGTAVAARAAFNTALTAADLVVGGASIAYALTRPPGHHAGRDYFGGSCYLNHAAGTAEYLRTHDIERVAIIDIDAHHGNGTQSIFYERSDVWFGSVHIDPASGWYPHFVGFPDEVGRGAGEGANVNIVLPEEAGDHEWVEAVATLCALAARCRPEAVVVSLGVDAASNDPNSPLRVSESGFRIAGAAIAGLGAPTVFVQEGGYVVDELGALVLAVLDGFTAHR